MSLFFRLLSPPPDAKGDALLAQVAAHNAGAPDPDTFAADPADFALIPRSPFAYWVGPDTRALFKLHKLGEQADIKQGLATADDFQFLRCWWEVIPNSIYSEEGDENSIWFNFAKGGAFSPYYSDIYLVVNWQNEGAAIKNRINPSSGRPFSNVLQLGGTEKTFFLRSGLTWPLRTNGFSVRALPRGCIFGHKGPCAFIEGDTDEDLLTLVSIMNSEGFGYLVQIQLARTELAQSYEVGLIRNTPIPIIEQDSKKNLATFAQRAHDLQRQNYVHDETSHVFGIPALPAHRGAGATLADAARAHAAAAAERAARLAALQAEIDERVAELYELRMTNDELRIGDGEAEAADDDEEDGDEGDDDLDARPTTGVVGRQESSLVADLLMWCVGVAFGRWDASYALDPAALPPLPGPFAPLPRRAPGARENDELRMTNDELEEGSGEGRETKEEDDSYLVYSSDDRSRLSYLVDDPDHPNDIVRRVVAVLEQVYGARAEAIEREACAALGVDSLRDYFRDPRRFFTHHIRRYSKSRRKAPIYWLLQSARRHYGVWLYYPRIGPDTYLTIARDVVDGKVRREESELAAARAALAQAEGAARRRREDAAERQAAVVAELEAFRRVLDRVGLAGQHPDPNDGVLLGIAPLHELVPWKEAATAFKALRAGKYPWSSMAARNVA